MTVSSDIYRQKIEAFSPEMQVESLACPKFVPLVESMNFIPVLPKKWSMKPCSLWLDE